MRISGILSPELERLGLYLDEDEDLIYLKRKGEVLAVFATWAANIESIRQAARDWLKQHEKEGG